MGRFDRYVLSQLMVIFGFSSVVLVLIYWVNRAVRLFDWLIASGQSAGVFLEFTALTLPNVIRIVLPISAFVAAVYTANRMTSESEMVVVQATGYGPFRLARPVLAFGLIVGLFTGLLVHFAVPASFERLADRQVQIAENVTARLLTEGRFVHPDDGITLYIRAITGRGELQDVYLRDGRDPARTVSYTASRAQLVRTDDGPRLVMYDGIAQTYTPGDRRLAVTSFDELAQNVASLIDSSGREDARNLRELSTAEILTGDGTLAEELGVSLAELKVEGHQRFTQPMMAVIAPLIGFATLLLGGFSRFGIWNQIFGAVGLVIVLYLIDNAMADAALRSVSALPLVYGAPVIGALGVAGILLYAGRSRRRRGARAEPGASPA
ncbi:LPS export ABC transporter permease LptF [Ovoidimarina sediminis]|uniref:LPS export ABC transporter permease LptF n=1 Tax=Ovoidimarina sediminis TaxID=3079856 RepID=UPI002907A5A7|nr:LPS export ABC transporter permease LptF [Rhodophyticola sp. MJ-SS7]MDU8945653.1 LPS export ABC transporter permease LptF [Rhodophyticola sp. MJ-SS7]